MATTQYESRYICSIFPLKTSPARINAGTGPRPKDPRCTTFELKPVKRGDPPFVLEVPDMHENIPDPMHPTRGGQVSWQSILFPCDEAVKQLLNDWREHQVYPGKPGIMEIAGPTPTKEELQQLHEMQVPYLEALFAEADRYYEAKKSEFIQRHHRDAAEWLGYDRAWTDLMRAGKITLCPACHEQILETAAVCRSCGLRLKALPPEIAALNPQFANVPRPGQPVSAPVKGAA